MATDNIGVELLAATPFRHKVGTGPTGTIATVHQLPPTLMAQWYFGDAQSKVRPYVGAGINYTTFFNEDFNDTGKAAGLSDLSLKDSWGAAGQVGLDYLINRDWLLNMSGVVHGYRYRCEIQSRRRGQKVSTRGTLAMRKARCARTWGPVSTTPPSLMKTLTTPARRPGFPI